MLDANLPIAPISNGLQQLVLMCSFPPAVYTHRNVNNLERDMCSTGLGAGPVCTYPVDVCSVVHTPDDEVVALPIKCYVGWTWCRPFINVYLLTNVMQAPFCDLRLLCNTDGPVSD